MVISRAFQHGRRSVAIRLGVIVAFVVAPAAWVDGAWAQGRLDARYEAFLAGIPVGKGAWTIDIADDQFSASANGGTAGILKAFAGGQGTGASQGRIVNGQLVPASYVATLASDKKSETIRIQLSGGSNGS